MSDSCANIGPSGIRRRRLGGIVWLVVSIFAIAAMLMMHVSRAGRATIAIPVFLAAIGLLQAQARTCVVLERMDRRDADAGGPIADNERPMLRRQANAVLMKSAVIAVLVAAVMCAI